MQKSVKFYSLFFAMLLCSYWILCVYFIIDIKIHRCIDVGMECVPKNVLLLSAYTSDAVEYTSNVLLPIVEHFIFLNLVNFLYFSLNYDISTERRMKRSGDELVNL